MQRNWVIGVLVLVFVALVAGLFFTSSTSDESGILPVVRQVSNEEGSAVDLTGTKGALLALLGLVVVISIFGMAATMYGIFWFLNREVVRVQNQEPEPLLLSMSPQGNTVGATLANNAFYLVVGIGLLMTLAVIALLLLT